MLRWELGMVPCAPGMLPESEEKPACGWNLPAVDFSRSTPVRVLDLDANVEGVEGDVAPYPESSTCQR